MKGNLFALERQGLKIRVRQTGRIVPYYAVELDDGDIVFIWPPIVSAYDCPNEIKASVDELVNSIVDRKAFGESIDSLEMGMTYNVTFYASKKPLNYDFVVGIKDSQP